MEHLMRIKGKEVGMKNREIFKKIETKKLGDSHGMELLKFIEI